eukprot:229507-Chlamydomonas_euryale.AAC.6
MPIARARDLRAASPPSALRRQRRRLPTRDKLGCGVGSPHPARVPTGRYACVAACCPPPPPQAPHSRPRA